MKKTEAVRKRTPIKKRSASCYERKVARIEKWHSCLIKLREKPQQTNPNNGMLAKRKELLSIECYIEKIKKSNVDRSSKA